MQSALRVWRHLSIFPLDCGCQEQTDRGLEGDGGARNTAAIGLINLIHNLARYEQIVRLDLIRKQKMRKLCTQNPQLNLRK